MSEENKIVELKEEDLEKVSGGINNLTRAAVKCPCYCCNERYGLDDFIPSCNKTYVLDDFILNGTILGTCTNGWEAKFRSSPQGFFVDFYNKELNQTISKNVSL